MNLNETDDREAIFGLRKYLIDFPTISLRDTYQIKDGDGNLLGYAKRKIIAFGRKLWFEDLDGNEVGRIKLKRKNTYLVYDSKGRLCASIKRKKKLFGLPTYTMMDPSGDVIMFLRENKFYAADQKTILATLGFKRKRILSGAFTLDIHSETLDPFKVISLYIASVDVERKIEEERGGYD